METNGPAGSRWLQWLVAALACAGLLAIVLPALAASREAERRTRCRGNLKGFGLGMLNYHDAHQVFPPGIVAGDLGTAAPADGAGLCLFAAAEGAGKSPYASASALTLVLPFLEERELFASYNFKLGCAMIENSTATGGVVQSFICPSNSRLAHHRMSNEYYGHEVGVTDYLLNAGGAAVVTCVNPFVWDGRCGIFPPWAASRAAAGVFNINSSVSIRTMRDGTTNTFMVGEGAGGPQMPVGADADGKTVTIGTGPPTRAHRSVAVDTPWSMGFVGADGLGGYGSLFAVTSYNSTHNTDFVLVVGNAVKPNEGKRRFTRGASCPFPANDTCNYISSSAVGVGGFRSFHRGMVHMLYCDGSVRQVSDAVDDWVWVGLSTVQGREDGCLE